MEILDIELAALNKISVGNVHRGAHSTYWFRDMMTRKIYNIGWLSWNDNHFGGTCRKFTERNRYFWL